MNRLPVVLGCVCAAVYGGVAAFLAWFWFVSGSFDAVFMLGLISIPSSYLAAWLIGGENTHLEVTLIICLGLVQYLAVSWLVGRIALTFLPRRTN
jgi:hypothetical protein